MCGISGFNWEDKELGEKMNACLAHRGPDALGVFVEPGITLSHRRLSIIDLSQAANQPMLDESGELVIIFNGEIYNYKELKQELDHEYYFRTLSDTEVILAGYKKWGKDVSRRLNGIFAFAIWDKKNKELFCSRDHLGVKPLYYYWDGKKFIFASELSAILLHDIPTKLNLDAFNKYMRVLYAPEPHSMVENIFKLPPGSNLSFKDGRLEVETYYSPSYEPKKWTYKEACEQVYKTVHEAVSRQLVADVPVGIYLSGGIDSSAVLAAASKVKKDINTFSVGFELDQDEEPEKFNTDFNLAKEISAHFGATHHPLVITAKDVSENLEKILGMFDDPISNPTSVSMYFLSRFTKDQATVVLSGEGGDELFGGYERYRLSVRADLLGKIPFLKFFLPRRVREVIGMSSLDRLAKFEFEKDHRLSKVVSKRAFQPMGEVIQSFSKYVRGSNNTEALMMADLGSWLPDQALLLADKMTMRGSLEGRVPLLDTEVVNLSMSLPLKYKVDIFRTKKILKDAFKKDLPPILFSQPKRGWFSPGAKWLRRPEIQKVARKIISREYYAGTAELFDWSGVEQMLNDHIEKKEYNLTILWAIMSFQVWAKNNNIQL
jgi:asparagine synthase (glutamine-hydrolysing)